jgi:putative phage-type endonuclease
MDDHVIDDHLKYLINTLLSEHPEHIVSPSYNDIVCAYVKKNDEYKLLEDTVIINKLIELGLERSGPSYIFTDIINENQILYLKNVPQPIQKTPAWYKFRKEHITASNAWKAFGSPSTKNQLIYEKCVPLQEANEDTTTTEDIKIITPNLSENAMTWGHMFEPLTRMIYESINNTSVMDFGCIEHPKYSFLAASPDGIIVGPNNYGRMLEIKNVVSREINGIPKLDYYIQTQLQMEVCDLNECDFVETKFVEYDNYNDYITSINSDYKTGIIMVYVNNGAYIYSYMPFHLKTEDEINEWLDTNKEEGEWIKNVYWKLQTYSSVLIKRKKEWFEYAIPILQDIWNIICTERIGDFSARAPRKRNIKININKIE